MLGRANRYRRSRRGTSWLRGLTLTVAAWQASSAGTAHGVVATDGSLGPAGSLSGPNYSIPASLGQQHGANLFHSFGTFDLDSGETATFSGPSSVANVLARVTDGSPSVINGTIR